MKLAKCFMFAAVAASAPALASGPEERSPEPRLTALDLHRVEEAFHVCETLGDSLWPGFNLRKIPSAINNHDVEELLIGHPNPPPEFHPWEGHAIAGMSVMRREGSTRYAPLTGGWAVNLEGTTSAYVGVKLPNRPTEDYVLLLLHEAFHVQQKNYRPVEDEKREDPPENDPVYSAMLALEGKILYEALTTGGSTKQERLARMFVAVRQERRSKLNEGVIRSEEASEYGEGTASYIQARALQLLAKKGGIKPLYPGEDPDYHGFAAAKEMYESSLADVLPPPSVRIAPEYGMYELGMASCLLLDRLRPAWKQELMKSGDDPFTLVLRTVPVSEEGRAALVSQARETYGYDALLAEQTAQAREWDKTVQGYLNARGRKYIIYHETIPGKMKWKPKGPVYLVGDKTIWTGGIRRFEKGDLLFESHEVPIVFTDQTLEWTDGSPDPEGKDLKISFDRKQGEIHQGLVVETNGFRLSAPLAAVTVADDVVVIRALEKKPATDEPAPKIETDLPPGSRAACSQRSSVCSRRSGQS